MKIAYIKWLDAHGHSGTKSLEAINRMGGIVMESAGILVGEDEEVIRIVQDTYCYDSEEGSLGRDIMVIPQKYVISKQIFEVDEN